MTDIDRVGVKVVEKSRFVLCFGCIGCVCASGSVLRHRDGWLCAVIDRSERTHIKSALGSGINIALRLKLVICGIHRISADAEIACHAARGGQFCGSCQFAGQDLFANLFVDLII